MEDKIITLELDEYNELRNVLASDQQVIYFRCSCSDSLVSIPNVNKSKANDTSNEKNIVEKWMEAIKCMAEIGYRETNEVKSEQHFTKIKAYCEAVIVSVTS